MTEGKEKKVCPKCGFQNPEEAVFCLKCGSKIQKVEGAPAPLEGLTLLHIVGSLYTILSAAFNPFIRESTINVRYIYANLPSIYLHLLPFYAASGILGLCTAYALHRKEPKKWIKWIKILLSSATVALGFAGTFMLFMYTITLLTLSETVYEFAKLYLPLVDPAWIIFLITAVKLLQDRHRL